MLISVNTFWTILLIVHGLLAVALLGALTHQAVAVADAGAPGGGPAGFVTRFRAVPAAGYATAVCVLWILTFIMGAWIYTKYRIYVRIPIEQAGYWKTQGFFDFKEHVASIGLVLLPVYWYFWKNAQNPEYDTARKVVTVCAGRHVLVPLPRRPRPQQCPGVRIMSTTTTTQPRHEQRRQHRHWRHRPGSGRSPSRSPSPCP